MIWNLGFTHLPILGELGGLLFQDQNKKNKTENSHWSLVISKEAEAETKAEKREKRLRKNSNLSLFSQP